MAVTKDVIFVGDTYPVAFECFEPKTVANRHTQTPKTPTSCLAWLWSLQDQANIPLGDGVDTAVGDVTENVAGYTIPAAKTVTPGDYKVFLQITFPDGQIVTESVRFKISART